MGGRRKDRVTVVNMSKYVSTLLCLIIGNVSRHQIISDRGRKTHEDTIQTTCWWFDQGISDAISFLSFRFILFLWLSHEHIERQRKVTAAGTSSCSSFDMVHMEMKF